MLFQWHGFKADVWLASHGSLTPLSPTPKYWQFVRHPFLKQALAICFLQLKNQRFQERYYRKPYVLQYSNPGIPTMNAKSRPGRKQTPRANGKAGEGSSPRLGIGYGTPQVLSYKEYWVYPELTSLRLPVSYERVGQGQNPGLKVISPFVVIPLS